MQLDQLTKLLDGYRTKLVAFALAAAPMIQMWYPWFDPNEFGDMATTVQVGASGVIAGLWGLVIYFKNRGQKGKKAD